MKSVTRLAAIPLLAVSLIVGLTSLSAVVAVDVAVEDDTLPVAKAAARAPAIIASRDYFHVAPSLSREYYDLAEPTERRRILVSEFDQDGAPRFTFLVPKKRGGFEIVFGYEEGTLSLYGFKVDGKRVKSDLVVLSNPAVIGTAEQALGGAPHQTAIQASAPVDVDIKGIRSRVDAQMTGSITSTWHAAHPVKVSADRNYENVVALKMTIALHAEAAVFGLPMGYDLDTTLEGTLAKGFGYVELRIDDDTFRLLPE